MSVSVEELASMADAYEVFRAGWVHDLPDIPATTRADFLALSQHPRHELIVERYLARLDGTPVGYLELQLPRLDNLGNATVELTVNPAYRRRGAGRALFEVACGRARAMGRHSIDGQTRDRHPDGAAFAAAMGASPALAQTRSRLELPVADPAALHAMLTEAWAHAAGHRLIQWTGVPPDEIIADVAYLEGRLIADAPSGDLDWEPQKVDADRVRRVEQNRAERGRLSYQTGALVGDRLVAYTSVVGHRTQPEHAWQNITLVDPEHRGHRLGLLVKLANLAHVTELRPSLAAIDTFNAPSNEHMLRINRLMGFRAVDAWVHWQLSC